jgi:LAS superfamily LD-carboxypeptidase LdcB
MDRKKYYPSSIVSAGLVFIILGSVTLYETYEISLLKKNVSALTSQVFAINDVVSSTTRQLSKNVTELNKKTIGLSYSLSNTQQNVDAVKTQVGGVAQTVGSISSTVGTLQKLSEIDPMLLKKYSKVYFTNENYNPAHLTIIPSSYVYSSGRQEQTLTESWPHLKLLLDTANSQNIPLYVKSSYRSFAEQKSLKTTYSVIYGAGTANAFSADQGYSEHQLGTTVDLVTTGTNGNLVTSFDTTGAYLWLSKNAYLYGFILSYPKGNGYYVYEPWHWRYVGVKLATYLHDNNLHFYDMDQRDIDKYLVNLFD